MGAMMSIARNAKIVVTGGAGFLGSFLIEKLKGRGYTNLFVPRHAQFDLTREADVEKLYAQEKPAAVIHLAAQVGGIGANRENPGRFFYANMVMGVHLIEHARRVG